jgi:hypothetical protein
MKTSGDVDWTGDAAGFAGFIRMALGLTLCDAFN